MILTPRNNFVTDIPRFKYCCSNARFCFVWNASRSLMASTHLAQNDLKSGGINYVGRNRVPANDRPLQLFVRFLIYFVFTATWSRSFTPLTAFRRTPRLEHPTVRTDFTRLKHPTSLYWFHKSNRPTVRNFSLITALRRL